MGGLFAGHPWHEKVGIKIDDPDHPLVSVFAKRGFYVTDEIYQFRDPYSREDLRVLLSLDMSKTSAKGGRKDGDYAVSWIHSVGEGRVFYCSLGHRDEIFWNPRILQHYLDGVQYALGDLKADDTPSAELSEQPKAALCPDE
jgi:type 1 glutamine amidotransferase